MLYREALYRYIAAAQTFLIGYGILDTNKSALWAQLAVATVTSLFSMLYATTSLRVALYGVFIPSGAVLMGYGLISGEKWAVLVSVVGQIFGVTTAAAKTIQPPTVSAVPFLGNPDAGKSRSRLLRR